MREGLSLTVIALIGLGLILTITGTYFTTFYKRPYFVAEDATIFPGEAREIFVVPNSEIIIKSYSQPLCPNGRLIIYDNYGNIVWQSNGRVPPEKAKIKVTTCHSPQCTFKIVNTARCTLQEAGPNALGSYSLYVYYTPKNVEYAGRVLIFIGIMILAIGVVIYKRNKRNKSLVELEPP